MISSSFLFILSVGFDEEFNSFIVQVKHLVENALLSAKFIWESAEDMSEI